MINNQKSEITFMYNNNNYYCLAQNLETPRFEKFYDQKMTKI